MTNAMSDIVDQIRKSTSPVTKSIVAILKAVMRNGAEEIVPIEANIQTLLSGAQTQRIRINHEAVTHADIRLIDGKIYFLWSGYVPSGRSFPKTEDIASIYNKVIPPITDQVLNRRYLLLEIDPKGDLMAHFRGISKGGEKITLFPFEFAGDPNRYIEAIIAFLTDPVIVVGDKSFTTAIITDTGY